MHDGMALILTESQEIKERMGYREMFALLQEIRSLGFPDSSFLFITNLERFISLSRHGVLLLQNFSVLGIWRNFYVVGYAAKGPSRSQMHIA